MGGVMLHVRHLHQSHSPPFFSETVVGCQVLERYHFKWRSTILAMTSIHTDSQHTICPLRPATLYAPFLFCLVLPAPALPPEHYKADKSHIPRTAQ